MLADRALTRRCLAGDEEAWADLVAKYKNLVYSIAIRKGVPPDEASDLFQAVWMQVYAKLSTLKKLGSIRSWLITVTLNECYHWNQKRGRRALRETTGIEIQDTDTRLAVEPEDLAERERFLLVQRAIGRLNPRCQELIRLLFYTHPPKPYKQVAAQLGLAIGSIGFIRGRCLKKLQRFLGDEGIL